jgi:hypothetical protein
VKHYSEDELTLYYYGEGRRRANVERHLEECAACAKCYREIAGTLAMIGAPDVPERGDQYGLEVWQRIRHRLPEQEPGFSWFGRLGRFGEFAGFDRFLGFAAAAAVLMLAAFIAGRTWSLPNPTSSATNTSSSPNPNRSNPANRDDSSKRILLTSVADHLDRSERVLTDIMNSPDSGDISTAQGWADDLLTTSRLYRQDALEAGEQSVATVLDDLERSLIEIVHSPSRISAADLEQIRRRIDAAALLFKVRVMSDQLRDRESRPGAASPQTPIQKTS